ncbi:hypothetical protein HELRODRAFT_68049, partial [Helobdella robusta]|uniref:Phospholipid-transporting ATPase n=1 Tax=Helobdella robusta TaxID=6412 RepID=T1FZ96_HELRO
IIGTVINQIFLFLVVICLICSIGAGAWEMNFGQHFQIYLPWDYYISGSLKGNSDGNKAGGSTVIAILVFFSYIIVLNTVVPISLYVSVELIRLGHSIWINFDNKMYHDKTDTAAKSRTTTLNEELGQIEYIFSDKTGTLTQNIMTFNKCSINGMTYGDLIKHGEAVNITDRTPKVDFSKNPYYEKTFDFYDDRLLGAVEQGVPEVHEFFRLLALCHTVMSSEKDGGLGVLEYQAQSPDEAALVGAARNFGFVYKSRTPTTITLEVMGEVEVYEQLCILDFNNVRKRMSVIVRKDDRITLLCKGADTTIYQLLDPNSQSRLKDQTTQHLETFAQDGLRTLCLSSKEIDPNYFTEWKKKHHEASTSMEDREDKMSAVYEEIETGMKLLGATAIEDKLQDGVPETIANLASADIKIWVLTGDKQETAINIGYSCQLLTEEMSEHLYVIESENMEDVKRELTEARDAIMFSQVNMRENGNNFYNNNSSNNNSSSSPYNNKSYDNSTTTQSSFRPMLRPPEFGLIINGHSLTHALKPELELLLLEAGCMCKAVICCRVTPLQKALVVSLVKKHKKSVTLSIGDGANDVSMIKMAHIGVGISGQEGMQAVLASDYSIAQFRFLERLLLVHGRWSYLRMCKFLKFFFYKNFAFTLCHFWFGFYCGFSAQTLYDPFFITFYNVFYTSLPIMALGFFEQDVNEKLSLQYPNLYKPGHLNLFFNKKIFLQSVLEGFLTSLVLFFVPYGAYQDAIEPNGLDVSGHKSFGLVVASCLIVSVTLRCGLDTMYWTGFNHFVIWGSIIFFFVFTTILYLEAFNYSYSGVVATVWSTATFWFTLLLTVIIVLTTVVAERFYFIDTRPTLVDKLRYHQKIGQLKVKVRKPIIIRRASTTRRSQRSVGRTGYAFSHQQGFGDLITSGSIMRLAGLSINPLSRESLFDGFFHIIFYFLIKILLSKYK